MTIRRLLFLGLSACLAAGAAPLRAQQAGSWPTGQVRIVVPFPPGGPTDAISRLFAQKLTDRLGQTFLIENKPGAGGNIGMDYVAKSKADGHTLLYMNPVLVTNPYLMKASVDSSLLTPVFQVLNSVPVLLVNPAMPARTVPELLALIRTREKSVTCGSVGSVFTVGCALLQHHAKAEVLRVPYRGQGPAMNALISGEIDILFDSTITAVPQVKGNRVRALATLNSRRGRGPLGELPVVAETIPGFELFAWQGLFVPKDTPAALVQKINQELNAILALPEVTQKLTEFGNEPMGGTPEAFARIVRRDSELYGRILQEVGVKPE